MATVTVYLVGNGTSLSWTPPTTTTAQFEYWGAGQAGDVAANAGASGYYCVKTGVSLTSGTPISFQLGAPGLSAGANGGDTWVISSSTMLAPGGGSSTTAIGDTKTAGTAGVSNSANAGGAAGGGAGAPGPHGSGKSGGIASASTAGGGAGGGNGGGTVGGASSVIDGTVGGVGGNGFAGTGGIAGASSADGGPGGPGAGGGGGFGNGSISSNGGPGGDDFDNGGGGGASGGGDAVGLGNGGAGGTPGGGGGPGYIGGGTEGQGGWSVIKITWTSSSASTTTELFGSFPGAGAATGTLAVTEASDTLSAAASVKVVGTLAKTEASDTISAAASVKVVGTLAKTEASDTISAAASVSIQGALAKTEASDTISAAGSPLIGGTLAVTEAADTLSAAAQAGSITAALTLTEAADTIVAAGSVSVSGHLTLTEASDTLVAFGNNGPAIGRGLFFEAADTLAATGSVAIVGTLAVTEVNDFSTSGGATVLINAPLTEPVVGVPYQLSGFFSVTPSFSYASDAGAFAPLPRGATTPITPIESWTLAHPSPTASGSPVITVTDAVTGGSGTLTLSITSVEPTGRLALTEAQDTLVATGTPLIVGALQLTEAPDTTSAPAPAITGRLLVFEAPDTLAAAGSVAIVGTLALTEAQDVSGSGGPIVLINPVPGQGENGAPATISGTFSITPLFTFASDSGGFAPLPIGASTPSTPNETWSFPHPSFPSSGSITVEVVETVTGGTDSVTVSVSEPSTATGTLALTEAPDTLAARGSSAVVGTLAITEANDTLRASGGAPIIGTLAITEAVDTLVATGSGPGAHLQLTEAPDTLVATGSVPIIGTLAITEQPDFVTRPVIPPAQIGLPAQYTKGVLPILPGGSAQFAQKQLDTLANVMADILLMIPQPGTEAPIKLKDGMKRLARSPWRPVAGQGADAWVYWDAAGQVWRFEGDAPTTT